MRIFIVIFVLLISCKDSFAQDPQQILVFQKTFIKAQTDAERINALAAQADYYLVFSLNEKADSLLQKALSIAETSDDKSIPEKILFNSAITGFNFWSNEQSIEISNAIISKGLKYAEATNNHLLEARAHIMLAEIHRIKNEFNEAVLSTSKAFSALANAEKKDSVEVELYCELGDIYLAKADAISACKNYNIAFEKAYRIKDYMRESKIYHKFSDLYKSFDNPDAAKDYLFESLKLNSKINNPEGKFSDYIDLAKITNNRDYIEKAIAIAVQLNSPKHLMIAKRLMYYWIMVEGKNSNATFDYLKENPALLQFFTNSNPAALSWERGNTYKYAGSYDSALYYFNTAKPQIISGKNSGMLSTMYHTIAETYLQNNEPEKSRIFYEKTLETAEKNAGVKTVALVSAALSKIYADKKDFENAYKYSKLADSANEVIQSKAGKDKMVLMQMDRENNKQEIDRQETTNKINRKNNLQLMAITISLTIFFALMVFAGMFEVSKTMIKTVGYFAFISLFEFIVLLLDHPIIAITNGEPLKLWICKIFLIAMLVPLQHFLEKRLIGYLQSRDLLEARKRISFKKWFAKKPVVANEITPDNIEDTPGVL
jgi:hypothetical protein